MDPDAHLSSEPPSQLVIFALADNGYALPLSAVDRVVRMVEITPLPKAPDIVVGVINVQGKAIPVINMRKRFGLPQRDVALSDQLVIAHTARRPVALMADAVTNVVEYAARELIEARTILPDLEYVQGVAKLDDGLILIHDLNEFLSLEEEAGLAAALQESQQ